MTEIEIAIIHYDGNNNEPYADLVVEALRKQMPKKPQSFDSVPRNRCPICHDAVRVYSDSMKLKYCCWCGQALDWSDTE